METLKVGSKLTEIQIPDLNGEKKSLIDFNDRHLLINFWSMRCFSCMKAAGDLKKLNEDYADKLNLVSINLDTEKSLWEQGTNRDGIKWTNLSDGEGFSGGAGKIFGITGYPSYVLVNPEGVITDRWMGYKPGRIREKVTAHITP